MAGQARIDQCVRINRHALPGLDSIQGDVDYNDSQYSSRDESVYWIRYVA